MEIVSTSKKKDNGLEVLLNRKAELKQQIQVQQVVISTRTKNLFTPTSMTTNLFHSFNKGLNVVDAVLVGYKLIKSIRTIFRKFKK